jgi:hypothetical protein
MIDGKTMHPVKIFPAILLGASENLFPVVIECEHYSVRVKNSCAMVQNEELSQ